MRKGSKHTLESRIKIGKNSIGTKASMETRLKQSIGIKNNLPKTAFKKGNKPANYGGGKYINFHGYILVLSRNHPNAYKYDYVLEHRLVMEKHIGRYLTKEEVVHHINSIKTDNRIENLMLFKNQQEHLNHHGKEENRKIKLCLMCKNKFMAGMGRYCPNCIKIKKKESNARWWKKKQEGKNE